MTDTERNATLASAPGGASKPGRSDKDWATMSFLALTPIVGVAGTALYTWFHGFHLWMPMLFLSMYLLVGLSICAGYHRFFSHKSYEASRSVQTFFAIFGAMAAQNSILWWSASHRVHHKYVDRDWDPYNIKRGFWWAHILWIFHRHGPPDLEKNAGDLMKNPVVMWQNRWYKLILIVAGFGLPAAIGALFGDAVAGLLWGGFLRLAVIHHTTFFVNSLAHFVGKPRYNAEISARDNWVVAFLTLGEGYHSFHHRFPSDFRNGIRWYDWDPAKWFISALRAVGLASDLRSAPPPQVQQALMQAELHLLEPRLDGAGDNVAEEVRRRIALAKTHLQSSLALWRQYFDERAGRSSTWRTTRHKAKRQVREARRQWKYARRILARYPESA